MVSSTIGKETRFPATKEITSAMEMAVSIEAAQYLAERVTKLANESKFLNKSPELKANIIAAIQKFADYMTFKLTTNGQPWSGQQVESSSLKNMQRNIADYATKELSGKVSDVKLDYAVSNDGHYVRAYSSSNGALDSQSVASMDQLLNAWFAENDYVVKGGYLYRSNDTVQNESTRASPEVVKNLLSSGGLQTYLEEKGFNATMKEREYPSQRKETQAKQEVTSAMDKTSTSYESTQQTKVETEEEAPHVTAGSGGGR